MRLEGLGKQKIKIIHLFWSRTRDLPACSTMPQSLKWVSFNFRISFYTIISHIFHTTCVPECCEEATNRVRVLCWKECIRIFRNKTTYATRSKFTNVVVVIREIICCVVPKNACRKWQQWHILSLKLCRLLCPDVLKVDNALLLVTHATPHMKEAEEDC
jgi:hypothetical protein